MGSFLLFLLFLISVCALTVKFGKLTLAGALTGGLVALALYLGFGLKGIAHLAAFFLPAILATSLHKKQKQAITLSIADETKRDAYQVLANGGVAALCALLSVLFPADISILSVMMTASFSSAIADTLSSELGTLYGTKFYNVLTFRKDKRGENGVVSIEGFLIGLAGSVLIAAVYALCFGFGSAFYIIIVAGTFGNLSDSVLGATLERRRFLNNNQVNFLNTLGAAFFSLLLYMLL
jgi:uncharacterized protein (TIGR00297 family)